MQMTDRDKVNPFSGDTQGFQSKQRCRTAIEQETDFRRLDEVATVTSPPATERIACA
jgi:hypothetical protein